MSSSPLITLLTAPAPARRGPSALLASILLHSACLLLYGLRQTPRMEAFSLPQRATVRLLSLPRMELTAAQLADASAPNHPSQALVPMTLSIPTTASLRYASAPSLHPTPQTLVQPDAPAELLPPPLPPIPTVVMWSADHPPSTVVSATPNPAEAGDLRSSRALPNSASDLAELAIAPTLAVAPTPQIAASTTAPLPLRGPEPAHQIPETATQPLDHASPTRIVSLSEQQVEGPIRIPFANAAPAGTAAEPVLLGATVQTATAAGEHSGDADGSGTGLASGTPHASDAGRSAAPHASADASGEPSVTRITMPKDGQFGVVVVGSSLADDYPETVAIWSGRFVYTVYLHVGLRKSWILQYALPPVEEASSTARPEAPWPYEMVRPEQIDLTSAAVMVHGFVDVTGHFARLAIVSPTGLPQSAAVLDALRQWQFRPARQNGQLAEVEVLLVIPEESE